jgi:hypothetical protein
VDKMIMKSLINSMGAGKRRGTENYL